MGESCCTTLTVTGGSYSRSYGNSPFATGDPATVSTFRLDKYDVTVGRFRQFVAAWNNGSGWTPTAGSGKHTHLNGGQGLVNVGSSGGYEPGWLTSDNSNIAPTTSNLTSGQYCAGSGTWTSAPGTNENLPINCVNWWEAYAFCIWDGGFLPTEAEWEYAAGGGQMLDYPWGSTTPGTMCPGTGCSYAIYGCYYPNGSGNFSGTSNIAPVGTATLGAGPYGQLDLAGELWQWNLDWDQRYVSPCVDCAYLTDDPPPGGGGGSPARIRRGGGFCGLTAQSLEPWYRLAGTPTGRSYSDGLRCGRTP